MSNSQLYFKCKKKNFVPKHVAEVGVYKPEESNVRNFIIDEIKATLVEPDPSSISAINTYFKDNSNIILHECAVYDTSGSITLMKRGASTFIKDLTSSPATVNDQYVLDEKDEYTVECKVFSEIDDGSIDLLSIDIEGAEWYVIKHLKSRPSVISVETHGKYYTNPYLDKILGWMDENGYQEWYKDDSDTVFVKNGEISVTLFERLKIFVTNRFIGAKRLKKWFKKSR